MVLALLNLRPAAAADPTIIDSSPRNGFTNALVTTSVSLSPSEPVNAATVNEASVKLIDPGGNQVPGSYNSDAAGGIISFTPAERLAPVTFYDIVTTTDLKSATGVSFTPFTATFRTGRDGVPVAPYAHERQIIDNMQAATSVAVGPDGKLYATNGLGEVRRYTLGSDGVRTGAPERFFPFGTRTIIGLAFDPRSTPSDPIVWVSHNAATLNNAPEFSGKVSVLSGPTLTNRDVITGLPRSVKDHMTNGLAFGPDGKLYIAQGSMTGYGATDQFWCCREETLLSSAILVADVVNDPRFLGTLSVNTSTGYDPGAPGAPVTVHAEGLRNAYDMNFHSNGGLYVPVNEAAAGNTPADPDGDPPALTGLLAGRDFLALVRQGRYYGHPNASQGHYTLNGGNPTAAVDPYEQPQYPVGTPPDPLWDRPVANFGNNRSANGITEFRSGIYDGRLVEDLLITEFSNGDDVVVVGIDSNGNSAGITQLATGLLNPVDVTTHGPDGWIYVAEYGDQPSGSGGQLTLLRPTETVSNPVVKVNFQSQGAPVPAGHLEDYGQAFDANRGYGWIRRDNQTPFSMVGLGRDRGCQSDQRLDTFMHMQFRNTDGSTKVGRWEYALPNGIYDVTVSVGDCQSSFNSDHRVFAEDTVVIGHLVPNSSMRFANQTSRVAVTDGRLTLDAKDGRNTKINYVEIDQVVTPK